MRQFRSACEFQPSEFIEKHRRKSRTIFRIWSNPITPVAQQSISSTLPITLGDQCSVTWSKLCSILTFINVYLAGALQKSLLTDFLCAPSVSSVSLWCVFARNSSTTETRSTLRLHREERSWEFLCQALAG